MKKFVHKWSWTILLAFCIIGLFKPVIGFAAIVCMLAPVLVAFFKGRYWCGNFCPRGSFNDIILSKLSSKAKAPKFLKTEGFRFFALALVMGGFITQLYFAWGNLYAIGAVFVRMIIITTILTIILGTIYSQRTWCTICPMGTMAHYVTKMKPVNRKIKHVKFDKQKCVSCNLCTKSCPINIDVLKHKDKGIVTKSDCLKCGKCIDKCPKDALHIV